jgi:hypothetical protein
MGFFSSVGSALNSVASWTGDVLTGGAMSQADAMQRANDLNVGYARENRAWQEKMSNTAYQRQVQDLEAAGLNKMIALGGAGASVPSGAVPTVQAVNKRGSMIAGAMSQVEKIMGLKSASSAIDVQKGQAANLATDTDLKKTQNASTFAGIKKIEADTNTANATVAIRKNEIRESAARAKIAENERIVSDSKLETKKKLGPANEWIKTISEAVGIPLKAAGTVFAGKNAFDPLRRRPNVKLP